MHIHTREELIAQLGTLGVKAGDTLFVHSSYKSLGRVEGGADTVLQALRRSVTPDGLLLMPSFNLVARERRAEIWDHQHTPSTVGWLTEVFRRQPQTWRSDHYSHSVAAWGRQAQAFVSGHRHTTGMPSPWDQAPWGKTYGTHSPMFQAYQSDGRLLMLGVDYDSSTYIHLVEVMYWAQQRTVDPQAAFRGLQRPLLGMFWDRQGHLRRGRVGDADCRLFSIRHYVDTLLAEVSQQPWPYLI